MGGFGFVRGGDVAGLLVGADFDVLGLQFGLLGVFAGGEAFQDGIGDASGDEFDGADGVVVGGDGVVDDVGVAVGVDEGGDGDAGADGLGDGDVFLGGVDDEDGAGEGGHLLDAAQVAVEAGDLLFDAEAVFFGEGVQLAAGLGVLQADEVVDAALDGVGVGEGAAEPAGGDVGHAAAFGFGLDGFLGLTFGADEEDGVPVSDQVADEVAGLLQAFDGLLEVDDVDAVAFGEDEFLHLGVPAAGLVAEVNPSLQQGFHRCGCGQIASPYGGRVSEGEYIRGGALEQGR